MADNGKGKNKGSGIDYGQLTVDALNRYHNSPEFTARYKKWLLSLHPECLTPVAKADLEKMLAEEEEAKAKSSKE